MFGAFHDHETASPIKDVIYPMQARIRAVCVFGGASTGHDPRLGEAAEALGASIGAAGLRLIYGGGRDGLMGAIAGAAARAGSEVIAIAPRFLMDRMRMPAGLSHAIAVPDMHMRKRLMFDYADAFVALPGGIGTIEELAEVMTWRKLERHGKPILLANFHGFWSPWLGLLDHLEEAGFLSGHVSSACLVADAPEVVLPMLQRGVSFTQEWSTDGTPVHSATLAQASPAETAAL